MQSKFFCFVLFFVCVWGGGGGGGMTKGKLGLPGIIIGDTRSQRRSSSYSWLPTCLPVFFLFYHNTSGQTPSQHLPPPHKSAFVPITSLSSFHWLPLFIFGWPVACHTYYKMPFGPCHLKGRFHEPTKHADESTLVSCLEANDQKFGLSQR